jgi:hypothetical protein
VAAGKWQNSGRTPAAVVFSVMADVIPVLWSVPARFGGSQCKYGSVMIRINVKKFHFKLCGSLVGTKNETIKTADINVLMK